MHRLRQFSVLLVFFAPAALAGSAAAQHVVNVQRGDELPQLTAGGQTSIVIDPQTWNIRVGPSGEGHEKIASGFSPAPLQVGQYIGAVFLVVGDDALLLIRPRDLVDTVEGYRWGTMERVTSFLQSLFNTPRAHPEFFADHFFFNPDETLRDVDVQFPLRVPDPNRPGNYILTTSAVRGHLDSTLGISIAPPQETTLSTNFGNGAVIDVHPGGRAAVTARINVPHRHPIPFGINYDVAAAGSGWASVIEVPVNDHEFIFRDRMQEYHFPIRISATAQPGSVVRVSLALQRNQDIVTSFRLRIADKDDPATPSPDDRDPPKPPTALPAGEEPKPALPAPDPKMNPGNLSIRGGGYLPLFAEEAEEQVKLLPAFTGAPVPAESYALVPTGTVINGIEEGKDGRQAEFRALVEAFGEAKEIKGDLDGLLVRYRKMEEEAIEEAFADFFTNSLTPKQQQHLLNARGFFAKVNAAQEEAAPLLEFLAQARSFGEAADLYYQEGVKGVLKSLARQGCNKLFEYFNGALAIAGTEAAGPLGGYAARMVGGKIQSTVCGEMLSALFEPSMGKSWLRDYEIYHPDKEVDEFVRIFYTGERSGAERNLPAGLHFFAPGRPGANLSRKTLLDRYDSADDLRQDLDRHFYALWALPELRPFLDTGQPEGKAGAIWQTIAKYAAKDWRAQLRTEVDRTDSPGARPRIPDLEGYLGESWLFGGSEEKPPAMLLISKAKVEGMESAFPTGKRVNVRVDVDVLGIAGREGAVNVEWKIIGGGPVDEFLEQDEVSFRFSKNEIRPRQLLKTGSAEYSFVTGEGGLKADGYYALHVTLAGPGGAPSRRVIPFRILPDEKPDDEPDKEDPLLEILRKLHSAAAVAGALSAEIHNLYRSGMSMVSEAVSSAERAESETAGVEERIASLEAEAKALQPRAEAVQGLPAEIEGIAQRVIEAKHRASALATQACDAAETAAGAPTLAKRNAALQEAHSARDQASKERELAGSELAKAKALLARLAEVNDSCAALEIERRGIDEGLAGLRSLVDSSTGLIEDVHGIASEMRGKISQLDSVRIQAVGLLEEGRRLCEERKEDPRSAEWLKEMEGLCGRVVAYATRTSHWPDDLVTLVEPAEQKVGAAAETLERLLETAAAIRLPQIDKAAFLNAQTSLDVAKIWAEGAAAAAGAAAVCCVVATWRPAEEPEDGGPDPFGEGFGDPDSPDMPDDGSDPFGEGFGDAERPNGPAGESGPGTHADMPPGPDDPEDRPSEPEDRPVVVPAQPEEAPKPFYAVYAVHAYPNLKPPQGVKVNEWLNRLNPNAIRPSEKPAGYIAFHVTGDMLKEYVKHRKEMARGNETEEYLYFRPGHRYHQMIYLRTSEHENANFPVFLSFFRIEPNRPDWVKTQPFGMFGGKLRGFIVVLSDTKRRGPWSFRDKGSDGYVSTYHGAALTYDGPTDWKLTTKAEAINFIRLLAKSLTEAFEEMFEGGGFF